MHSAASKPGDQMDASLTSSASRSLSSTSAEALSIGRSIQEDDSSSHDNDVGAEFDLKRERKESDHTIWARLLRERKETSDSAKTIALESAVDMLASKCPVDIVLQLFGDSQQQQEQLREILLNDLPLKLSDVRQTAITDLAALALANIFPIS